MEPEDKKSIPRRQSNPVSKNTSKKLSKEQQEEIKKTLRAALIQYQEQIETERDTNKSIDLETLDNIISEHIGPYILIGFNLNNEPVEIFSAKDPLEAGALSDHFKKVFIERTVRHGSDVF